MGSTESKPEPPPSEENLSTQSSSGDHTYETSSTTSDNSTHSRLVWQDWYDFQDNVNTFFENLIPTKDSTKPNTNGTDVPVVPASISVNNIVDDSLVVEGKVSTARPAVSDCKSFNLKTGKSFKRKDNLKASTTSNTNVSDVPVVLSNVAVACPINSYKIPDRRDRFSLQVDKSLRKRENFKGSTKLNSSVADVPIVPANVLVVHPANSYKIPNMTNNSALPSLNSHINKLFEQRGNLKVSSSVMTTCPQYVSTKGCYTQFCSRFHVCQFWIKGNCNRDDCQYEHGFSSIVNNLIDILRLKIIDKSQIKNILKQNMFRGNKLLKKKDSIICTEFMLSRCKRDNCKYYHLKNAFAWQIHINDNWVTFPQYLNKKVENLFALPYNNTCSVHFQKTATSTSEVNPVFLWSSLEVDFDKMTLTSKSTKYDIRRLSTGSDIKNFSSLATRWIWYWEDDFGWSFYEKAILEDTDEVVISFSDYLETAYLKERDSVCFKISDKFKYVLNFSDMIQINQITGKKRRVRRRPMPTSEKSSWNENTTVRSLWSITNDSCEKFIRTPVSAQSHEYSYFRQMIEKTLSLKHFSLERIENTHLWNTYQIKKAQMLDFYSNNTDALNEQYLFHCTSKSVVDKICEQNLDWRLYGTKFGKAYGRGTYFSNSAALSNKYSSSDEHGFKWMFIILVLVGKASVGDKNIAIPPINPSTKMRFDSTVERTINPTIFVKYNLDDYYPVYIVKYS